ncbi:MAG: xanthine dehydrogenase family protein molybdopterin-binding subunit [Acidobacteriaceae bacterium]|nr:xanthine dehydrogenase family protein molybdopterin-binding subunit [Acidobacteriaceae bacterium]
MATTLVGTPVNRVDGHKKVTGTAQYAAEVVLGNMTHAVLVGSSVAGGEILNIRVNEAESAPGVLLVLTHENVDPLGKMPEDLQAGGTTAEKRPPFSDARILHNGQYVAMVVAETLEQARHAASLIKIEYKAARFAVSIEDAPGTKYHPAHFMGEPLTFERGNVREALDAADVKIDVTYRSPSQHPCALEPHAAIASWSDESLTVYNASQWVQGDRAVLAGAFNLPADKVKVICPFTGGMFGSKGATGAHVLLAAIAAKRLRRPVKVVLSRPQVLTDVGHRSETIQRLQIGAKSDGTITALSHHVLAHTSLEDDFPEPATISSRMLYRVDNYRSEQELFRLNVMKPSWMRAPGEAPGQYALESALDELAEKLGIDPLDLRRRNHADINPQLGKPFSNKHLLECYDRGAERFGWSQRNPKPRSMRDGKFLLGWGMATATYPGYLMGATVKVRLQRDASGVQAILSTAGCEVGTGIYTMLTMTAADELGMPIERVSVQMGNSDFTHCAVAGGSNLTASTAPATKDACAAIKRELLKIAGRTADGFTGAEGREQEFLFARGRVAHRSDPSHAIAYEDLMNAGQREYLEGEGATQPIFGHNEEFAFQSFGAHFVEVKVKPEIGRVRVSRMTSVFDCGRILSAKTARSQFIGGLVFGIGAALLEELEYDRAHGQPANSDLASYLVPVHADVPEIDVSWIDAPDYNFNSMGCRGIGEIGITGVAAAIGNAVYHATGKRVRDLPITPDKLLNT